MWTPDLGRAEQFSVTPFLLPLSTRLVPTRLPCYAAQELMACPRRAR
ncbi:hypothetical protein trd_A0095 (plasmid) [Thermomicrobium roseum DSM 5159]|uniref:Uncharacterized protein n=1 Tax=Thermomicrobium roseum (strain ATCC 27502 / DSM 5159 / P-2) TaxID=309801 RepID=B9L5G8_THERP|nr:hypothetical protein trd_A0095 [Thermomicrobium roseum DSM 5159]